MPYVNIKVTGGAEAPTAKQKAELIEGVKECCRSRILRNVTAKCEKFKILQVSHL